MTKHVQKEPYYAVIFTSKLSKNTDGYDEMNEELIKIIDAQDGFIGIESMRDKASGITVSYWENVQGILSWKENEWHKKAMTKGKKTWYQSYTLRICKVEREYSFNRDEE